MTAKSDLVQKRLSDAGITGERCDRYVKTLQKFLSAKLTKASFETEMHDILPRDKISVHNSIIRELLYRAQQRRDGIPDLPVLTPALERPVGKIPRDGRPVVGGNAGPSNKTDRSNVPRKRPREREDADTDTVRPELSALNPANVNVANGGVDNATKGVPHGRTPPGIANTSTGGVGSDSPALGAVNANAITVAANSGSRTPGVGLGSTNAATTGSVIGVGVTPRAGAQVPAVSGKPGLTTSGPAHGAPARKPDDSSGVVGPSGKVGGERQGARPTGSVPDPVSKQPRVPGGGTRPGAAGPASTASSPTPRHPPVQMVPISDVATYNMLQFSPLHPSHGPDLGLFMRVRKRVRTMAVEQMGMTDVKEDAVALIANAVESHVRKLVDAAAGHRVARQAVRPTVNKQCAPVRGHDFREVSHGCVGLFGGDINMEMERLSMLLY